MTDDNGSTPTPVRFACLKGKLFTIRPDVEIGDVFEELDNKLLFLGSVAGMISADADLGNDEAGFAAQHVRNMAAEAQDLLNLARALLKEGRP